MKRVPQVLWSLKALWQNALQVLGEEEMDFTMQHSVGTNGNWVLIYWP